MLIQGGARRSGRGDLQKSDYASLLQMPPPTPHAPPWINIMCSRLKFARRGWYYCGFGCILSSVRQIYNISWYTLHLFLLI
jgi:hypothetical protein